MPGVLGVFGADSFWDFDTESGGAIYSCNQLDVFL